MTSGTLQLNPNTYTTDGAPNRADISWSATWNQSTLQWYVQWSAVAAGNTRSYYVTIFSGTVTFKDANGNVLQTKSMSGQIAKAYGGTQLIAGDFYVGVDSLGNQTLNISGTFQIEYNGSGNNNAGTSQGSGSYALDQKPLASTISSLTSNVAITSSGGSSTVNISANSSSYTHRIYWYFYNQSHYEDLAAGVTSKSYTIPATWLQQIPSSATGTGTVTVTTYYSGTQIGSPASASFTVTANVYPSVGSLGAAPRGTAYTKGITNVYISGYSTAYLTASASGVNGSSVAKYEFIKDGSVIATYNTSNTSRDHTTGALSGSSASFSVRVTDSRGRQATSAANTITIQSYAPPSISGNAFRCDSSNNYDSTGTRLRITATASATPSANSIYSGYPMYATRATGGNWTTDASIGSGVTTAANSYPNTSSYEVRITARDKLDNYSYQYFTIPTAAYTMDFKVGGTGVAFGKVAETSNLLDSQWSIRTANDLEAVGNAKINGTILGKTPSGSYYTVGKVIIPPIWSYGDLGVDTSGGATYFNAWMKKICETYPSISYTTFIGTVRPNSLGTIVWHVYGTGTVDSTTGLPQYSSGYYFPLTAGVLTSFGTSNYSPWCVSGEILNYGTQTIYGTKTFNGQILSSKTGTDSSAAIYISNGTANTDTEIAVKRTDTGNGIELLVGSGGVNRGLYYRASGGSGWLLYYDNTNCHIEKPLALASALTVANGGTGATTAKAARSNLNMVCNLLSGSVGSTEVTVSSDITEYSAFIITGVPSSNYTATCFVPKAALSTTATKWQLADEARYIGCDLRTSGTSLLIKVSGSTTSGKTVAIYGLRGA